MKRSNRWVPGPGVVAVLVFAVLWLGAGPGRADELPASVQSWMHFEQKRTSREVDRTKVVALDNHQDPRYAPEAAKHFALKTYWLDAGSTHAFQGSGLDKALEKRFVRTVNGKTQVRLLVHPESETFYAKTVRGAIRGEDMMATATASSRTLLVWEKNVASQPFFVKVSLDKEIAGTVRTVPAGEVARSVGFNNTLHADRPALPESFQFLPEVFGLIPKGMERGGMIVRSIPETILSGKNRVMPLFSLYADGPRGSPPILVEMINKSGMNADDFIRTKIIRPFARQFIELSIEHGIVMEPHAQNVLLEIDGRGMPTGRFVHRDFGGFNIDFAHRESRGRSAVTLPVVTDRRKDYHEQFHKAALATSLSTYFEGGFLFPLGKKLADWGAAKLVERSPSNLRLLEKVLHQEIAAAYKEITGEHIQIGRELREIAKPVEHGRTLLRKRSERAGTKRPRARGSAQGLSETLKKSKSAGHRQSRSPQRRPRKPPKAARGRTRARR